MLPHPTLQYDLNQFESTLSEVALTKITNFSKWILIGRFLKDFSPYVTISSRFVSPTPHCDPILPEDASTKVWVLLVNWSREKYFWRFDLYFCHLTNLVHNFYNFDSTPNKDVSKRVQPLRPIGIREKDVLKIFLYIFLS